MAENELKTNIKILLFDMWRKISCGDLDHEGYTAYIAFELRSFLYGENNELFLAELKADNAKNNCPGCGSPVFGRNDLVTIYDCGSETTETGLNQSEDCRQLVLEYQIHVEKMEKFYEKKYGDV